MMEENHGGKPVTQPLRRSPLHDVHVEFGAHFTNFAGWDMPLRFGSELDEHRAVRERVGIFDLSHMGEIRVHGPQAADMLTYALTGDFTTAKVGRAKYTLMLTETGGILDDLIVYRLELNEFLLVPNAGNTSAVHEALHERSDGFDVTVTDENEVTALIAVQGPKSEDVLRRILPEAVTRLSPFGALAVGDVLVSRTGYTGEDGFEIYVPTERAEPLWRELLAIEGVVPAGLAARDSLRLEAGLPLYCQELSRHVTPAEVCLGWTVSFTHDFVGRDAIEGTEPKRVLVALRGETRRAGRAGYPILLNGSQVGVVTSGLPSPTLGVPIAFGLVDVAHSKPGTSLDIDVRGTPQPFSVVPLSHFPDTATRQHQK